MRLAVCFLLAVSGALAQDLTPKAPPQRRTVGIVNATIHPVSGPTIKQGYVVFTKGRITAVGAGPLKAGDGIEIIDGRGKHVYPGFIAPYTQLGLREIGAVRATRDMNEVGAMTPEAYAAVAVNPDSTLLPVTRSNGVLVFGVFPRGGLIPGRASVMRTDGWTWEDMAVRRDAGLVVAWPGNKKAKDTHTLAHAFAEAAAYLRKRKSDPKLRVDVRKEAFEPSLARKRPVFFLADTYDQITGALAFARRNRLRAVIVGGRDAPLCADLLKRTNTPILIRSIHRFPKRADADFDETYRLPAKLEAAGLTWCLASGERIPNERNLPYAAGRACAYGLDRDAAIRAITLSAAKVLGVDKDLGSIEKGKAATLFICNGDPLEIPTKVEAAWIDGRRINLSNKQKVLFEKYKAKYGLK